MTDMHLCGYCVDGEVAERGASRTLLFEKTHPRILTVSRFFLWFLAPLEEGVSWVLTF